LKCKKIYRFACVDLVNAYGVAGAVPSHDVWLIFIGVRHNHHEKDKKRKESDGKG